MAHPNVPKFGNWDGEDNVPYTVYFDKARKNKGVKMINPNDPGENPEMFQNLDPLPPAPPSNPRTRPEEPTGKGTVKLTTEHKGIREGNEFGQFNNSPARSENMGQMTADESNYGGLGQKKPGRAARSGAGFDQNFERSPLHPQHQARVTGRGNRSSAVEENKSYDSSHGIPGRSRPKQVPRDASPDNGATVPRFGEWDEGNPQSAENFTDIFNKVREERSTGTTNISGTPKHLSYDPRSQPSHVKPKKYCCCPWW